MLFKKIIKNILFLVILFIQLQVYSLIVESDNLAEVYKYIDNIHKDLLVVFDIDNTIAEVSMGIEPWVWYKTEDLVKKGLSHKEAFHLVLSMYFLLTKYTTLIPLSHSPKIVNNLQKRGYSIIALTNRSIPVIERTIERLKLINIDFSKNSLYDKDLELNLGYVGRYSKGIIFTGSNDKGEQLFLFLKKINYTPKKIIMFDDKMKNIKAVEKAAKEHHVEYVGIRFSLNDQKKKKFDPKEAEQTVHKLKIKLGFEPLGSMASIPVEQRVRKKTVLEVAWDVITWPYKKIKNLVYTKKEI